jgi:hypothetical protein
MATPRAVAVIVWLLWSSAGSAQPLRARANVPLPVPAAALAAAVNSQTHDRSLVLLDIVRMAFDAPDISVAATEKLRARVQQVLRSPTASGDIVPLPLHPQLWRDVILQAAVPDTELIAAIFNSRTAALLYYGLSAVDDETLEWIASQREVLLHLRKHPGAFAACGRSLRVRSGRVLVPGGTAAGPIWKEVVGSDPADAPAFVRGLFRFDRGRTAYLYDTIAQLDARRQAFALTRRPHALADVFHDFARDWDVEARPFARPQLDPSLLLTTIRVDAGGNPLGPMRRSVWERVFRDDLAIDVTFKEVAPWSAGASEPDVDAAWLASRIHRPPYSIGRRRLDTLLFAQRVLDHQSAPPHITANVLRGFASMPALMLTLERAGVRELDTLLSAARHAQGVNSIGDEGARENGIALYQAAIGLVDRGVWSRALSPAAAAKLIESLTAIPIDRGRGYDERIAAWLRSELFKAAPQPPLEASDPLEEAILSLLAGLTNGRATPTVVWEGTKYRVDPAGAEMARLRRVRQRQAGLSIDQAVTQLFDRERRTKRGGAQSQRDFREALVSVLYAPHLGDPEGPALAAGNVAIKHDLGLTSPRPGVGSMASWRFPVEMFGGESGWRVQGSLLGLEVALRRLALRRLDPGQLPAGPKLPILERQTAMLTVALMNPHVLTDEDRDRVSAALARGRHRVDELRAGNGLANDVADKSGLSGWRREALKWSLTQGKGDMGEAFTLVDLFWLGADGSELHAWGAASQSLTGCLCLAIPDPVAWENLTGRPGAGLMATLGIDVTLRLADALAERKLPAALLAGLLAFAMQDVVDEANPAYFDDWPAFSRAARAITQDRIDDYIAALSAGGPLVPASRGTL